MTSKKNQDNDASSIILNSAIPNANNNYIANIVYMENHEGLTTDVLALKIRRLFSIYKCTDLVIDTNGRNAPFIGDNKCEVRKKSGMLKCKSESKAIFKSIVRCNA